MVENCSRLILNLLCEYVNIVHYKSLPDCQRTFQVHIAVVWVACWPTIDLQTSSNVAKPCVCTHARVKPRFKPSREELSPFSR